MVYQFVCEVSLVTLFNIHLICKETLVILFNILFFKFNLLIDIRTKALVLVFGKIRDVILEPDSRSLKENLM